MGSVGAPSVLPQPRPRMGPFDAMYYPVSAWFAAFLLTVLIEAPVVALLVRRQEPDLVRLGLLIVFANLATHPAVWFVFPQLLLVGTLSYTLVAEGWAVATEACFYGVTIRSLSVPRAIGVALAANVVSFLAGQAIGEVWPQLFR